MIRLAILDLQNVTYRTIITTPFCAKIQLPRETGRVGPILKNGPKVSRHWKMTNLTPGPLKLLR